MGQSDLLLQETNNLKSALFSKRNGVVSSVLAPVTPGWQGLLGNAPNSLSTHNKMLRQWKFPHEHPTPCVSSAQTSFAAPHPHDLSTHAGLNLTPLVNQVVSVRSKCCALTSLKMWTLMCVFLIVLSVCGGIKRVCDLLPHSVPAYLIIQTHCTDHRCWVHHLIALACVAVNRQICSPTHARIDVHSLWVTYKAWEWFCCGWKCILWYQRMESALCWIVCPVLVSN